MGRFMLNPARSTLTIAKRLHMIIPSGRNSVVECQLPKLDVVGSNPIARSNKALNPCIHEKILKY